MLLTERWPVGLSPSRVPFARRTVTVLKREGYWGHMPRLDAVSESEVLGWWYSGQRTLNDLTATGDAAIAWHLTEGCELVEIAEERWTSQVWRRDPRFCDLLPAADVTVAEVCRRGSHVDQRELWANLPAIRATMGELEVEAPGETLRRYVGGLTGQSNDRLTAIMRVNGLEVPPMTGAEAASRLGVSTQRVSQLARRMREWIEWATPPDGVWMPQTEAAERLGQIANR